MTRTTCEKVYVPTFVYLHTYYMYIIYSGAIKLHVITKAIEYEYVVVPAQYTGTRFYLPLNARYKRRYSDNNEKKETRARGNFLIIIEK